MLKQWALIAAGTALITGCALPHQTTSSGQSLESHAPLPAAIDAPQPPAQEALPPGYYPGDGTLIVNSDIPPGTYRTAGPRPDTVPACIWQRKSGFTGDFHEVLANGIVNKMNQSAVVTIKPTDKAFEVQGCLPFQKIG